MSKMYSWQGASSAWTTSRSASVSDWTAGPYRCKKSSNSRGGRGRSTPPTRPLSSFFRHAHQLLQPHQLDGWLTGGIVQETTARLAYTDRMKLTDLFIAELDRELPRTRRLLENFPEGKADWKPHDKSMALGYLGILVAMIPQWIQMAIERDELDIAPKDGSRFPIPTAGTRKELVELAEKSTELAKAALRKTNDDVLLNTNWKLLAGGHVASDTPRYQVIRETINHMSHHRGQLTVYMRLNGEKVTSLYGPTADDKSFG